MTIIKNEIFKYNHNLLKTTEIELLSNHIISCYCRDCIFDKYNTIGFNFFRDCGLNSASPFISDCRNQILNNIQSCFKYIKINE